MKEKLKRIAILNDKLYKMYDWMWLHQNDPLGGDVLEDVLNHMEGHLLEIDELTEPYRDKKPAEPVFTAKDFWDSLQQILDDHLNPINQTNGKS
jgi:hypothetical protein